MDTYRSARQVSAELSDIRQNVEAEDWARAAEMAPTVIAHSQELAASSSMLSWQLLTWVPVVGKSAIAFQATAQALGGVASMVQPLVPSVEKIRTGDVRGVSGSIDVAFLDEVAPMLRALAREVRSEHQRLSTVDLQGVRPEVAVPLQELDRLLMQAAPPLSTISTVISQVPGMLGADAPRDWLILLQNPAESRGSGGFVGGYAILTANRGNLRFVASGSSAELAATRIPADGAPDDARALWGSLLTAWNTYNLSPDFPLVAQLSASGMKVRGTPVSGVVAVDPATVARILRVTGPVSAQGHQISSANAVDFFTKSIYADIEDDTARNELSMALVKATFDALIVARPNATELIDALDGAGSAGGLRVWSADPAEEAWLQTTELGGRLPEVPGPVLAVTLNNAAGSKTDAYVQAKVTYVAGKCATQPRVPSYVDVTISNLAPSDLPDSGVYERLDDPSAPKGSTNLLVHVYPPVGSSFGSATADGKATPMFVGAAGNRSVWWTYMPLDRGQTRSLRLHFNEPSVLGVDPKVVAQAMVLPEIITVNEADACTGAD